ncbi:MAG: methyltransferase domain-containing protein [Nocardioidaceae bacterium]
MPGSAEAIPLPDSSVDAVVAGNAMHWFDMGLAAPEIIRVLRSDGVLAGLWNVFDNRVDWVAQLERVSGAAAIGPRDTRSSWFAAPGDAHLPDLGTITDLRTPQRAEFSHGQQRNAEALVATLATKAAVLVMPEWERATTLERVRDFLAGRPETAHGEFTLPMLTAVLRAQRL